MFNISDYLKKFSKDLNSSKEFKEQIIEIIKTNTGAQLKEEDIEIKNYIVYIKANPSVLNKIFIKKEMLLNEVSKISSQKIVDIK